MVTEFSSGGDLRRSIALLWGVPGPGRRGPKPSRSVEEVVSAAVALADAEGLAARSKRRVAEALRLSPKALYTYVPSKAELVDLMVDRVAVEISEPGPGLTGWREKVEHLARQRWSMAQHHPWLLQVGVHRPPLGPNIQAKIETTLQALDGHGLTEFEMTHFAALILNYVRGSARAALDAKDVERESGITDEQWWALNAELLEGLMEPALYPTTTRVGAAYKAAAQSDIDPVSDFEFGLQRVLDGIAVFIERRCSETV